jgi:hypothetical protein
MSPHRTPRILLSAATVLTCVAIAGGTALAGASTSRGQISVTQVREMLDQARTNPTARQVLTAYLAGVGETAGTLMDAARKDAPQAACKGRLSLDDKAALRALESAAPDPALWAETAATPLILRDMLKRAGCEGGR